MYIDLEIKMAFDNTLKKFDEIKQQWGGLFIGNGASRAISGSFAYSSLYDTASSSTIAHPICVHEKQIFDSLKTKNFEQVLSALALSEIVTMHSIWTYSSYGIPMKASVLH